MFGSCFRTLAVTLVSGRFGAVSVARRQTSEVTDTVLASLGRVAYIYLLTEDRAKDIKIIG